MRRAALPALLALAGCLNAITNTTYAYPCATSADCPPDETCLGEGHCGSPPPPSCLGGDWTVSSQIVSPGLVVVDVSLGDFNGDGLLDAVTLDTTMGALTEMLNVGGGTLATEPNVIAEVNGCQNTNTPPTAIAAADFNGDGLPDVAAWDAPDDLLSIYINNDAGYFETSVPTAYFDPPGCVGAEDETFPNVFQPVALLPTADGGYALAVVDPRTFTDAGYGQIDIANVTPLSVRLGGIPATSTLTTKPASSVTLANLGSASGVDTVAVLPGAASEIITDPTVDAGSGLYTYGQQIGGGRETGDVRVVDFNGDGYPDLVYVNSGTNSVAINFGSDAGFSTNAFTFSTLLRDGGIWPVSLVVADFDGDGRLDVATANGQVDDAGMGWGDVTVLHGCADAGLIALANFPTSLPGPRVIRAGNFLNDGGALPWLVIAYSEATQASILDEVASPCTPAATDGGTDAGTDAG